MQVERWIIPTDFTGYAITATYIDDATGAELVAYSGGQPLSEWEDRENRNYRVVTDEEYDDIIKEYHDSLVSKPKRIGEQRYYDLFECLPPCRYNQYGRAMAFHISERITGNLVTWCAEVKKNHETHYCEFTDYANAKAEDIASKIAEWRESI